MVHKKKQWESCPSVAEREAVTSGGKLGAVFTLSLFQ